MFTKRTVLLTLLTATVIVTLSGCVFPADVAGFADRNYYPIRSTADLEDFSDLGFLLPAARDHRIIMYGEDPHGTRDHLELVFRMMVFLNREAGYRYFAPEMDFAYSDLLNRYLETGNSTVLDEMDIWRYYSPAHSADQRLLWENLYRYNATLPADRRIRVIATDISHGLQYALRRLWRIPAVLPPGPARDELAGILSDGNGRSFQSLLPMVQTFEKRLNEMGPALQPIVPNYETLRFFTYSTRRSLELSVRQNEKGFDWDAQRETLIKEYFQWQVEHAGEDPDTIKVLAWNGAFHVSKAGYPGRRYEPVAAWLDKTFEWSRGRVLSIYSLGGDGQYLYAGKGGMKTGDIRGHMFSGVGRRWPEGLKGAALFTREPGVNGERNPLQDLRYQGKTYGERYDLLILLRGVRAAQALP